MERSVVGALNAVRFDPCLVLLARLDAPQTPWRGIVASEGPLQWVGCESSKRPSSGLCLALHASAPASREWLERPEAEVAELMWAAFRHVTAFEPSLPSDWQLKRWRLARPSVLATAHALLSESPPAAFCGDWCVAPRLEGAWTSGEAAAERLLSIMDG